MNNMLLKDSELMIKLSTQELNAKQIRLIKTMNSIMTYMLTATDEAEYFDASAQLMKISSELIQASNFASFHQEIPYGHQAVEYAMDCVHDTEDGDLDN